MEWNSDYLYEPSPPLFEQTLNCIPFSKYENPDLERGDKIVLPRSCLDKILCSGMKTPWLFQIRTFDSDVVSHCGVLEFGAEEGFVHMPDWMMQNLNIEEGQRVALQDAAIPQASFMKLQPHKTSFIELPDPREFLEQNLRFFSCLSEGDTFMIRHDEEDYYIDVLEVQPGPVAVCLIDTDCEVDFATPLDYKEPEKKKVVKEPEKKEVIEKVCSEEKKKFKVFMGKARRMDGSECSAVMNDAEVEKMMNITSSDEKGEEGKHSFKPFVGKSRFTGTI